MHRLILFLVFAPTALAQLPPLRNVDIRGGSAGGLIISASTAPGTLKVGSAGGGVTLTGSNGSLYANGIALGTGGGGAGTGTANALIAPGTLASGVLITSTGTATAAISLGTGGTLQIGNLVFANGTAATVNGNLGTPTLLLTNGTALPLSTGITGFGAGIAGALAIGTGGTGSVVIYGGAGGTPTSITLPNGTGLPVSTGITGFGTGIAGALATGTGGTGSVVIYGGAGGTPASIALPNGTGLPLSTGITGFGAGIAGALATGTGGTGSVVIYGGAGGTPTSITLTNGTGLPIGGLTGLGAGVAGALAIGTASSGSFVINGGSGASLNSLTLGGISSLGTTGTIVVGSAGSITGTGGGLTINGATLATSTGSNFIAIGSIAILSSGTSQCKLALGTDGALNIAFFNSSGAWGTAFRLSYPNNVPRIAFGATDANFLQFSGSTLVCNSTFNPQTTISLTDSTANFAFGSSSGNKLGTGTAQKIGFWNAAPIILPTIAGTGTATRVQGSVVPLMDGDTYDGYTIGQIVKALRNMGLLQ